jgi:hypothetical protein
MYDVISDVFVSKEQLKQVLDKGMCSVPHEHVMNIFILTSITALPGNPIIV